MNPVEAEIAQQESKDRAASKGTPQQPDLLVPWREIEATCKRIMKESNDLTADSADYRLGQWSGADKVVFALGCVAERLRLSAPSATERKYADGLKDATDYIAGCTFAARDMGVVSDVLALLKSFQGQGGYGRFPLSHEQRTDPSGGPHIYPWQINAEAQGTQPVLQAISTAAPAASAPSSTGTPRTDAVWNNTGNDELAYELVGIARQLERELASAASATGEIIGTVTVGKDFINDTTGPFSALPEGKYDLIRRADGGAKP